MPGMVIMLYLWHCCYTYYYYHTGTTKEGIVRESIIEKMLELSLAGNTEETRWAGHRGGGRVSSHKDVKQHSSLLNNKAFGRCMLGDRRLSEQVFDFMPRVSTLSCREWRVT